MPRRNKLEDLEFQIHVDPSCLSEPMDANNQTQMGEEPVRTGGEELYETVDWDEAHANLDLEQIPTPRDENDEVTHKNSSDDIDALTAEVLAGLQTHEGSVVEDDISTLADDHLDTSQHEDASEVAESVDEEPQEYDDGHSSVLSHNDQAEEDGDTNASDSRRESTLSSGTNSPARRASGRTEALIHAAARDIVAHIQHGDDCETLQDTSIAEEDSYISHSQPASARQSDAHMTTVDESHISADDESHISAQDEHQVLDDEEPTVAAEDAGDSSSHHENEDDVFSDHSPRSSMGSVSETEQRKMDDDALAQMMRSPRISDVSHYDGDEDDFVPTVRGTPRPPFRSPSSVKAIQMSSPPASVFGSPRSSRRSPLPTVSRLGSPSVSAQFSPKKTPPRFKRSTPPLVLLHATLLPLRWAWGDVMDTAHMDDLSQDGKTLREAWRQLQDRMGDTTLERGILLPHPQNDYEVLEERLLEALELPMRRRARILECGHYLSEANEMTMAEESDDDDYYEGARSPRASLERKTHWCSTCRSEIKYDSLGIGKVFRVKIYASNGLMKAGAWEACWKEMERVDVELEPIVEPSVQEELGHLATEQERALELQEADEAHGDEHDDEPEDSFLAQEPSQRDILPSSPVPEIQINSSPPYDDRRRRDEERLREIYGHLPATEPEPEPTTEPPASEYIPRETPPSPSVEAFERREERRQADKNASLPELLMEAARVLMQDRKNVMIVLLSVLIMALAVRGGERVHDPKGFQPIVQGVDVPTVTVTQAALQETGEAVLATMSLNSMSGSQTAASDPCATPSMSPGSHHQPSGPNEYNDEAGSVVSERVVRVVETITETEVETATVRVTATQTQPDVETATAEPEQAPTTEVEEESEEVSSGEESQAVEENEAEGEEDAEREL